MPTNEPSDDRNRLDVVQLGEYGEDTTYVFYPKDATTEDLKTRWIRSSENGMTSLTDQQ